MATNEGSGNQMSIDDIAGTFVKAIKKTMSVGPNTSILGESSTTANAAPSTSEPMKKNNIIHLLLFKV